MTFRSDNALAAVLNRERERLDFAIDTRNARSHLLFDSDSTPDGNMVLRADLDATVEWAARGAIETPTASIQSLRDNSANNTNG